MSHPLRLAACLAFALGACSAADAAECVADAASGLVWELKSADGAFRDRDKTYTDYSPAYDPTRELGKGWDAAGYVAAVNAAGLCGAHDWRLPTRAELMRLLRWNARPALDSQRFADLSADPKKRVYWTSSGLAGMADHAWAVDFDAGLAGDDHRSSYYALRLVRGKAPPVERKPSSAGDEVQDLTAGLAWRRCVEGMRWDGGTCAGTPGAYDFAAAEQRARSQATPRAAWRLPRIDELVSIIDDTRIEPAADAALFPGTPPLWFWSASVDAGRADYLWSVNLRQGHVGNHAFRHDRHALRLVRDLR